LVVVNGEANLWRQVHSRGQKAGHTHIIKSSRAPATEPTTWQLAGQAKQEEANNNKNTTYRQR
jgi:hypothetical protein